MRKPKIFVLFCSEIVRNGEFGGSDCSKCHSGHQHVIRQAKRGRHVPFVLRLVVLILRLLLTKFWAFRKTLIIFFTACSGALCGNCEAYHLPVAGLQGRENIWQVAAHPSQNYYPQSTGHAESVRAITCLHPAKQSALLVGQSPGRWHLSGKSLLSCTFLLSINCWKISLQSLRW